MSESCEHEWTTLAEKMWRKGYEGIGELELQACTECGRLRVQLGGWQKRVFDGVES